jgi:hypothetical protein
LQRSTIYKYNYMPYWYAKSTSYTLHRERKKTQQNDKYMYY